MRVTHPTPVSGMVQRPSSLGCLLTLHALGYADYDGKFFTLTPSVLRLGTGALSAMPLAQIVQPWLDQLSERIGQSCSVSILDKNEIVYIARAAQKRVMSIGLLPGSRLPAHYTSMDRVLLAALSDEEARAIIESSDLAPRTPYSLTNPSDIMHAIAEVRAKGYSVIDQEVEIGLCSLAVPVRNTHGRVVAAMNTGMTATYAGSEEIVAQFLNPLLNIQEGLRRVLN